MMRRLPRHALTGATAASPVQVSRRLPCMVGHKLISHRQFGTTTTKIATKNRSWKKTGGVVLGVGLVGGSIIYYYYYLENRHGVGPSDDSREKIVILGSGWGAMSLATHLDTSKYDVTIVSPRNYFLFTPLLPSITVGTLEPKTIIEPIRKHCRRFFNDINYYEANCTDIDIQNKTITAVASAKSGDGLPNEFKVPYDKLVVAVGAVNNTFGTPGVEENCLFLKEIEDAVAIRSKVLDCLELASLPSMTEDDKKRLLHFVVVGGGPTGVEVAAEFRDFLDDNIKRWFPALEPYVQITLVELMDHILSTYDAKISDYTAKHFKRSSIDIRTHSRVVLVNPHEVIIKRTDSGEEQQIPYGTCVWSTGIGTAPLTNKLREKLPPEEQSNRRALLTDKFLRVKGANDVYAIGDCATVSQELMLSKLRDLFKEADENNDNKLQLNEFYKLIETNKKKYPQIELYGKKALELFEEADVDKDGVLSLEEFETLTKKIDSKLKQLPATAQVANQQGKYLGAALNDLAHGKPVEEGFKYKHLGSFAYVGSEKAVADFAAGHTIEGFGAWWLWRSVYLSKQYTLTNKIYVGINWLKTLIWGRDITRA